jgi:hypothetical protein
MGRKKPIKWDAWFPSSILSEQDNGARSKYARDWVKV